jgi:hypothetical protein
MSFALARWMSAKKRKHSAHSDEDAAELTAHSLPSAASRASAASSASASRFALERANVKSEESSPVKKLRIAQLPTFDDEESLASSGGAAASSSSSFSASIPSASFDAPLSAAALAIAFASEFEAQSMQGTAAAAAALSSSSSSSAAAASSVKRLKRPAKTFRSAEERAQRLGIADAPKAVTRAELLQAIANPKLADTDLLALIARCADLVDDEPSVKHSVLHQLIYPTLRPWPLCAVLSRVAAPASGFREAKKYFETCFANELRYPWRASAPPQRLVRVARALFVAAERWIEQRYVRGAQRHIGQLWPDLKVDPLRRLIMEYFGDGCVCS